MSSNNLFSEEESSSSYYECFGENCNKINLKIMEEVQTQTFNENKNLLNEMILGEVFEKEFNKVFNENNNGLSEYENETSPSLFEEKIIKNVKQFNEKSILINIKEKNDKYFPFTQGIGIKKCVEKIGYEANYISPNCITLTNSKKINENIFHITKIDSDDYSMFQKENFKKVKKKRKFNPDDIRKKIKSRFHKVIKNIINISLKNAGSNKLFDFFPQNFISNITIKLNNIALNYTYEELIKIDISSQILKLSQSPKDLDKYNRNIDVLNYLDKNPKICKLSKFNKVRDMKYSQILKAYFLSLEFEESIIDLHNKGEKKEYIEDYINKSLNYVNFFASNKSKIIENNSNIIQNSNDNKDLNNSE